MSEYNKHKWAMEWMHGGGRDPNGRGLDEEIKLGKEEWTERQRVARIGPNPTFAPEEIDMPNWRDLIREEGVQVGEQVAQGGRIGMDSGGSPNDYAAWKNALSQGLIDPDTSFFDFLQLKTDVDDPIWNKLLKADGGRIGMDHGGQLVQPGPGRQGYAGEDIGVVGGEASAAKRKLLGLQPHEVTVYRRLVEERAAKRGIEVPNWDKHPGRGYSTDNLKGQNIAKDIKRRLVGSRKGSVIGVGSGTDVEGKILSKVDQDKIKKRFGSTYEGEWNFKTKKNPSGNTYGISNTGKGSKNYEIGQKVRNFILGQHGPNYAFDHFDNANYHLTQMYRAANLKVPNKNYRPIYSTKGIIGYVDLTEKGGGKEYYHADYEGLDTKGKKALLINKNHPDAAEINKLIEIVEGTKQDRTVLDSLFKKHGYETPSFERLVNALMDTEGAKYIDSAIVKHHQYGVGREPGKIQLLTRDKNMFAKLIERRVDTGKMTAETAGRLLKPEGVQIIREGTKIGAPDIKPEKQIKDLKKWVERKSTTVFEKSDKNVLQMLTSAGFDVGDCV